MQLKDWRNRAALAVFVLAASMASFASDKPEEVLVIAQDYSIAEMGKGGAEAKDVRQILYIRRDFVCIDELGGKAGDTKIIESIMLDLKNRQIINLDHEFKKKVVESFEARRARIDEKKKEKLSDIEAMEPGPQRDKVERLFHAMLDDNRRFTLVPDVTPEKEITGVKCKEVEIAAEKEHGYTPLKAFLNPDLVLPYDNTEVLYLLRIIGKHLADFLREHKDTFQNAPMELHIDLAAGGKLDTKVVSVTRTTTEALDITPRGALGSPFEIPANYSDGLKTAQKTPAKNEPEKEKP